MMCRSKSNDAEIFGLIGPNGDGRTTLYGLKLFRLIPRIPEDGNSRIYIAADSLLPERPFAS